MTQYQWKLQGEFAKYFGEFHSVNVMAGLEMRGNKTTNVHTKGFGYDPNSLTTETLVIPDNTNFQNDANFEQYSKSFTEDRFCHII